jgi:hypothetical protein
MLPYIAAKWILWEIWAVSFLLDTKYGSWVPLILKRDITGMNPDIVIHAASN